MFPLEQNNRKNIGGDSFDPSGAHTHTVHFKAGRNFRKIFSSQPWMKADPTTRNSPKSDILLFLHSSVAHPVLLGVPPSVQVRWAGRLNQREHGLGSQAP